MGKGAVSRELLNGGMSGELMSLLGWGLGGDVELGGGGVAIELFSGRDK